MTQDQELWGLALWLEKKHGEEARGQIAFEVSRLARAGDGEGVAMWRQVADRYDQLRRGGPIN